MLANGDETVVRELFDRVQRGEDGDRIAEYVEFFFPVVKRKELIGDVVGLMEKRGQVNRRYLLYLRDVADADDLPLIGRLAQLELDEESRTMVTSLMDMLR